MERVSSLGNAPLLTCILLISPPKGLGPVIPKARNCLGIWKKLLLRRNELKRLALDTDHARVEVHNLWEVLLQYILLEEWCAKKWLLLLSILLLNPRPNSGLRGSFISVCSCYYLVQCYYLGTVFQCYYLGTCIPMLLSRNFSQINILMNFIPYYVVR